MVLGLIYFNSEPTDQQLLFRSLLSIPSAYAEAFFFQVHLNVCPCFKVRELNQTGSPFDNNRANRSTRLCRGTLQELCSQAQGDQSIDAAIKIYPATRL